jgi:hypothetical protein
MSAKKLERYSHTRNQVKRDAVNKLTAAYTPAVLQHPRNSPVNADKNKDYCSDNLFLFIW